MDISILPSPPYSKSAHQRVFSCYRHLHNAKWKIHHHCEYGLFATDGTDKGLGYVTSNRQVPLPGQSPNVLYPLRGIKCLDLRDGTQLWEFNTNEMGVSFPFLKNNLVYFSTDRTVYALSEYMGHLEWMATINQSPSGNFAPEVLYGAVTDGRIFAWVCFYGGIVILSRKD